MVEPLRQVLAVGGGALFDQVLKLARSKMLVSSANRQNSRRTR